MSRQILDLFSKRRKTVLNAQNSEKVQQTERQGWIGCLARADAASVTERFDNLEPSPQYKILRPAEIGSVMVRGRTGGTGSPFSFGEMTVTRCVIQLEQDTATGHAYVAGRDKRHAEAAAVFDALLQTDKWRDAILETVIDPLRKAEEDKKNTRARKVAATKVEFFTMVRGDD